MATPRLRLGQLLVDAKMISEEDLTAVLALQRGDGRRLGVLLVERGLITEMQLTQILSHQLSIPWVSLLHIEFSRQLLNLVPRDVADRYCLVPIYVRHVRHQGETLYVAMDDPTNEDGLRACREHSGLPVRAMIAPPTDIRSAIRAYYGVPATRPAPPPPPSPELVETEAPPAPESEQAMPSREAVFSQEADDGPPTEEAPAVEAAPPETDPLADEHAMVEDHELFEVSALAEAAAAAEADAEAAADVEAAAAAEAEAAEAEAAEAEAAMEAEAAAAAEAEAEAAAIAEAEAAAAADAAEEGREPLAPALSIPAEVQVSEIAVPGSGVLPIPMPNTDGRPPGSRPAWLGGRTPAQRLRAILQQEPPPPSSSHNVNSIPDPRGPAPRMVRVTLLNGTTISLPAKRSRRVSDEVEEATALEPPPPLQMPPPSDPPPSGGPPSEPPLGLEDLHGLTARDLVIALRVVAHGADASEVLGNDVRWEAMFAALLSLLLKKHVIADWEFVDELKKQL